MRHIFDFVFLSRQILILILCRYFGTIKLTRIVWSAQQVGAEINVVTAFYTLILATSTLRAIWFLIPNTVLEPTYVPHAVKAFDKNHPSWYGWFISEELLTAGSLFLFSIFILILVYWDDILKKYFSPGTPRRRPMQTFSKIFSVLLIVELANAVFFLLKFYSNEGMILVNSILLASVSIVCVVQITIFSNKFRTVLQTLGAINQVSTEAQVKRIVWITVTGNAFFFTRAALEIVYATMLIMYWTKHGTVTKVFSHPMWDTYVLIKHWSEVIILALMLYILQIRFTAANEAGIGATRNRDGYEQVPDQTENRDDDDGGDPKAAFALDV